VAQSSSFDIEEDNAIKGSNLSDDTGASVSVDQPLNYEENGDPSNANEKNQESRAQVLKSKVQFNSSKKTKTNKVIYDPVDNYIERIPSNLTDNSLPSIDEILLNVIINSSRKTTLSHSNNVENDGADIGVRIMSSISSHNEVNESTNISSNNNNDNINNTTSINYLIVLITDPPPTISLNNDKQELAYGSRIPPDLSYNKESKYLKRKHVQYTSSESNSYEFSPSNNDNEQANNENSDQVYNDTLAEDQGPDEKSKRKSGYDNREQDKGKQKELLESSSDSEQSEVEKAHNKKKKLSCDPSDLQGMFSQCIDFNEASTPVLLESLPKHLKNETEYNILIQALLGDPKFSKFSNPKGEDVLILADIAEKLY
ncbi:26683_t:CDS:10, partial [Dentiscutata erythropus]